MDQQEIYLASKSPRRRFLLKDSGFDVNLIDIDVDESYPNDLSVNQIAEFISNKKADACIEKLMRGQIGITADTIVVLDGKVLEKPSTVEEARSMLSKISGTEHTVYTGVTVCLDGEKHSFTVESTVHVSAVSDEDMEYYIEKYKPFDKAGSYGIQEWFGYTQISKIEGSYTNIMGLPMHELYNKLKEIR